MFDCAGRRVTVMGLGRFGGGLGVTRWLASQGADVLVTDFDDGERLREPLAFLRDLVESGAVSLRLGEHNVSDFTTCDLVVANPAVARPWENRFLRAAQAAGIPITTEIELLIERLPQRRRTIGVTGSAGKSTTAAMIDHILTETGRKVMLGGNIGGSLLARTGEIDDETWIVLELSSAMLHWLTAWSPHVAVVTGFSENHLDWHGDAQHYRASKERLLRWQRPGDVAALQHGVASWDVQSGVRRVVVPADAVVDDLAVAGRHNGQNAALAAAACAALGIDGMNEDACRDALRSFAGLPHRLQFVGEFEGARFYNDSKSTTPEATMMALGAFGSGGAASGAQAAGPGAEPKTGRIHLIAGGYDKGSDLSDLARTAPRLGGLYTIGATGPALAGAAAGCAVECGTLERAITEVFRRVRPGDIVLLSPGCASWDQFVNYEARGDRFAALVRERITGSTRSQDHAQAPQPEPL